MSFDHLLGIALHPSQQLPSQLHLGEYPCSWENGKLTRSFERRPGFRCLSQAELRQLVPRLQAAPHRHVILLDLYDHDMRCDMMREMAAPIAALKGLEVLNLSCTCPPPMSSFIMRCCLSAALFLSLLPSVHAEHRRHYSQPIFNIIPPPSWAAGYVFTRAAVNDIGPSGCCALAEALPHLSALQVLYLSGD